MNKNSFLLTITLISLFFVFSVSAVLAENDRGSGNRNVNKVTISVKQTPPSKAAECQARESAIKTRMTQLTQLVATMEKAFDAIEKRVETFYSDKVLPSGKVVSNYDTLVSDAKSKKALVQTDLDAANKDISVFNCATGQPSTLFNQFRLDMQKVKMDLNNYRTSIRNLIVAIRTVSSEAETPEPTK